MNTVFRITLDIHKLGSQATIPCFQGDSGYTIIASLTESGRPYTIEKGSVASFQALKPDKKYLWNTCSIDNNTIVYDFLTTEPVEEAEVEPQTEEVKTCQTTAYPGTMECQFKLVGANGGILASPTFNIVVNKTVYNEKDVIVASKDEWTVLTRYQAELTKLESKANEHEDAAAEHEEAIQELMARVDSDEFKGPQGEVGPAGPAGPKGEKGDPYTLTDADKQEMVDLVLASLPNGDEVMY